MVLATILVSSTAVFQPRNSHGTGQIDVEIFCNISHLGDWVLFLKYILQTRTNSSHLYTYDQLGPIHFQ